MLLVSEYCISEGGIANQSVVRRIPPGSQAVLDDIWAWLRGRERGGGEGRGRGEGREGSRNLDHLINYLPRFPV